MSTADEKFAPFDTLMRREGLPDIAIRTFRRHFHTLEAGATGLLSSDHIHPVSGVTTLDEIRVHERRGADLLSHIVVIKLNGGLGTGMGLDKAKSLIPLRDGMNFLDIIARQVLHIRARSNVQLPLLFMDSYRTQADTLAALEHYHGLESDHPISFLQHRVPKVLAADLAPASCPSEPELAWCPPGHGDIYPALLSTGILDALIDAGIRYAFVSNADNLGAVLDDAIPGYMAANGVEFVMEVALRTAADKKGGHLARLHDGRLTLRESAQCPPDERSSFEDVNLFRYFNTNSIWIDLRALKHLLDTHDGALPLPLIRNTKTLDPRDPSSPEVYQLESAMGAAISLFDRAEAICVPRARFAPVKTTDDLLLVRSDAYWLRPDYQIVPRPSRSGPPPLIQLDPAYYRFLSQLSERFPHGTPSLLDCRSFRIEGDVVFGKNVVARGDVTIRVATGARVTIPDNAILDTELTL